MLEVAFSRRMCCSRVCSVSTNPRRPSTSVRLPRDAPRHPAQIVLARREEAKGGAAEVEAVAERLALPHSNVDAAFSRRREDAEHDRVDLGDRDQLLATLALGGGGQRGGVLDGAVEVGLGEDRRARVLVDRRRPRVGVGDADRRAEPRRPQCRSRARSVRSVASVCGCSPAQTTKRLRPLWSFAR